MSFRKERKYRLTASDAKVLRSTLLRKGMTLLHPNRRITSQYFDTIGSRAFEESEEGVLPRFKIRIRWYNDDQSGLTFERKVSSVEGRYKTTQPITLVEFENLKRQGILDRDYGPVIPSTVISYSRSYFDYKSMRITFDSDIQYSYNRSVRRYRDLEEVVEIKAQIDVSDDYLESILPVPTSRFSKYSRAFLHREQAI